MLQMKEIEQRFSRVEQAIGQARQVTEARSTPMDLKQCIDRLGRHSGLIKKAVQSNDERQIRRVVDDLEQLGDEAERACGADSHVTPQIKEAVRKMHNELSDLKHQLH